VEGLRRFAEAMLKLASCDSGALRMWNACMQELVDLRKTGTGNALAAVPVKEERAGGERLAGIRRCLGAAKAARLIRDGSLCRADAREGGKPPLELRLEFEPGSAEGSLTILKGGWLEHWVADQIRAVLATRGTTGAEADWAINVTFEGDEGASKNEIDAVGMFNNRALIIEAKTADIAGKSAKGNGESDRAANVLYKQDSVAARLAQYFTSRCLVSVVGLSEYDRIRADELKISVVEMGKNQPEDFEDDFRETLAAWLEQRPVVKRKRRARPAPGTDDGRRPEGPRRDRRDHAKREQQAPLPGPMQEEVAKKLKVSSA
jgi:hypothetical protein